jgi:hypothetical protein
VVLTKARPSKRGRSLNLGPPRVGGLGLGAVAAGMALRDGWFVRVKTAVDAVDPVGLLGLGVPKDAYDPEVAELAGMARSGQ